MNDIPLNVLFSALGLLIVLSAFFSGSETALMTLNRYRLQHLVKTKHRGAIRAQRLLQRPDRLIGLILLGNNFINILASSLTTVIAIRLVGEAGIALAAGILTLVILIFAEVAPKTLAAMHPEKLAFPASWVFIPLLKLLYPIVWVVNAIANLLLKMVGFNPAKHERPSLGKEELRTVVAEAGGLLPERYQNMLLGILDLESATVEDIMIPRNEIIGIDLDDPLPEIRAVIKNSPHTRLPVFDKTIDQVIGMVHLRQILSLVDADDFDNNTLRAHLTKAMFIPENTPLDRLLLNFKTEGSRIGLVVDEYGDVVGLATLEDLMQEIIGEIATNSLDVQKQSDGSYLVDASITIRELNRITNWSLPTEGPKTLNGAIIEFMETIPEAGTSLKLYGHPLEIVKANGNAVKLVRFYRDA